VALDCLRVFPAAFVSLRSSRTSPQPAHRIEFCSRQGPGRAMRAPLPPLGKTPGPRYRRPPPEDPKKMALGLAIRQAVATLGLAGWRSCERPAGTGTQKAAACARRAIQVAPQPFVKHHFFAPALAVSHFGSETRQSRQSRRGFLRRSSDRARQCQALKTGQYRLRASGQRRSEQPYGLLASRLGRPDGSATRNGARAST
jgi:hypothetical protein